MTFKTSYGASITYGPDDEYTLEVCGAYGQVYITMDENDPNCTAEDLTFDLHTAPRLARMISKAVAKERAAMKARIEEARKAVEHPPYEKEPV